MKIVPGGPLIVGADDVAVAARSRIKFLGALINDNDTDDQTVVGIPSTALPSYSYMGPLAVTTGNFRLYVETDTTIIKVRASVGVAPAGASVIADVRKNGTTIFTTSIQRPTITASAYTATGVPDVTALAANDYLTVDIVQVGSSVAGSNLVVTIITE